MPNDWKDCEVLNFRQKVLEIRALNKIWLKRQITPLGRVAVLKSLSLSKIIFLWIVLPNRPDNNNCDALQRIVFEFAWSKKQDRISWKTAAKNIVKGRLGIPNIRNFVNALKLIWISRLKTSDHNGKA